VEFCSPSPLDSGVLVLSVFVFVFLFCSSCSLAGGPFRDVRRGVLVFVLSRRWSVFVPKLFQILMLDLRLTIGFLETRATQMGSSAFPCSSVVISGCRDYWLPARDCHAPVKFSLLPARGGLVPAYFRRAMAAVGLWMG
jgi:hypothetical protein